MGSDHAGWSAEEIGDQYQTFAALSLFSTIAVFVVGLILNFWAAWSIGNFADRKGFSKRQYFWLSLVIGPLVPWFIASASNNGKYSSHSK